MYNNKDTVGILAVIIEVPVCIGSSNVLSDS